MYHTKENFYFHPTVNKNCTDTNLIKNTMVALHMGMGLIMLQFEDPYLYFNLIHLTDIYWERSGQKNAFKVRKVQVLKIQFD
jgi:hypothetical protein